MTNVPWKWPNSYVTRVVDGDSITARVSRDLGFHGTAIFDQRLRLNRINTPPAATQAGKDAARYLMGLLGWLPQEPHTPPLLIETVKAYKYGDEWMAEVTLPDGRNVSDEMVKSGSAVYWDGTGPRPGG